MMDSRFPCGKALQIVNRSQRPAIAVLWASFGYDFSCVARFLAENAHRPHLLEIHFSNEASRRRKPSQRFQAELYPSDSVNDYNKRLERMDAEMQAAIDIRLNDIQNFFYRYANANTHFVLSLGLEDNYSQRAYESLFSYIYSQWPVAMVRSTVKNKKRASTEYLEYHSNNGKPSNGCLANEDGNDNGTSSTKKFFKRYKKCVATFVWRGRHQGWKKGRFVPLADRRYEITDKDVRELGAILEAQK